MPPASTRKRRAQSDINGADAHSPPQRRRTQQTQASARNGRTNGESSTQGAGRNRRAQESEEDEDSGEEPSPPGDVDMDADLDDGATQGGAKKQRLVKDFVRLVLASEYSRTPIRRADIASKVLGQHGRLFKEVFDLAQTELRRVFGMELVELPSREKTKLAARRAATSATDKASSTSKAYILVSTLGAEYRDAGVIEPFGFKEQSYTGLVTFVVALIYLNGRNLSANVLNRYLRRTGADENTPVESTEKLLSLMAKHGYLVKLKDTQGELTTFEYHVGPRAKVEIGEAGVMAMVKAVYGEGAPEDIEEMVRASMGPDPLAVNGAGDASPPGAKKPAAKKTRRRAAAEDDDEDDDDDYV